MRALTAQEAADLARNIVIPPRPSLLVRLHEIARQPDPDQAEIATLIGQDITLAAAVLKAANSPWFNPQREITSIQYAIALLGLINVLQLTTGQALRNALGNASQLEIEAFWQENTQIAMVSALLGQQIGGIEPQTCYTFGLFRDCGIPVMLLRFPHYARTLVLADAAGDARFPRIEDELHRCNHVAVGYLVARAWLLPDELAEGILQHHDLFTRPAQGETPARVATLIAITRLAEHIKRSLLRSSDDPGWAAVGPGILQHLGLSETEYEDLRDAIQQRFHQH